MMEWFNKLKLQELFEAQSVDQFKTDLDKAQVTIRAMQLEWPLP